MVHYSVKYSHSFQNSSPTSNIEVVVMLVLVSNIFPLSFSQLSWAIYLPAHLNISSQTVRQQSISSPN